MKKYLMALVTIALVLSACTTKNHESSVLLVGSWKLISYGPANTQTPAVADAQAELTFKGDGTMTGNSGCNSLGGNYTVKGHQVTFTQIISTLMACDDSRMAQERVVQKVLNDRVAFKIEGNILTLTKNGMVLVLTKVR